MKENRGKKTRTEEEGYLRTWWLREKREGNIIKKRKRGERWGMMYSDSQKCPNVWYFLIV
jgi:hypothetical protein